MIRCLVHILKECWTNITGAFCCVNAIKCDHTRSLLVRVIETYVSRSLWDPTSCMHASSSSRLPGGCVPRILLNTNYCCIQLLLLLSVHNKLSAYTNQWTQIARSSEIACDSFPAALQRKTNNLEGAARNCSIDARRHNKGVREPPCCWWSYRRSYLH